MELERTESRLTVAVRDIDVEGLGVVREIIDAGGGGYNGKGSV
jgi:hypothetical protein